MKVRNISKGLIVLSIKHGKGFKAIPIQAGATSKDEDSEIIQEKDIALYLAEKSLEKVVEAVAETKQGGTNEKKGNIDPVILPDEVTADTLKSLDLETLKRWCKENGVTKYSKLKEDELIALILETLESKKEGITPPASQTGETGNNPPADQKQEGEGEA